MASEGEYTRLTSVSDLCDYYGIGPAPDARLIKQLRARLGVRLPDVDIEFVDDGDSGIKLFHPDTIQERVLEWPFTPADIERVLDNWR